MNIKDEHMDWEKEASHLASLSRSTPYRVPDNYFDDLQARINQSVFVNGLMQRENQGFAVPQNYFENLSEQIESKIATAQIKELVKEDGFKTPSNYFEKLNSTILDQTISQINLESAIKRLLELLFKYYNTKPILLIDEYDTPIQEAYLRGYYEQLISKAIKITSE